MSITFTITEETPELFAARIAWLNAKLGGNEIIAEVKAKRQAKEAIDKASSKPEPAAPVAVSPEEPISAAEAKTPELQEAAAPVIDKAALQKIASAKSKTVGVEKVKELISKFGGKNINTTPDEKLAELQTALEELA